MKEELQTVLKDIEDLEKRLHVLRERESAIRLKLEAPTELIGKYVKSITHVYTYYMRIDTINRNHRGDFYAEGPAIDICTQLKGTSYSVYSHHLFSISPEDEFTFVTKEEFDKALEEAIKNFK